MTGLMTTGLASPVLLLLPPLLPPLLLPSSGLSGSRPCASRLTPAVHVPLWPRASRVVVHTRRPAPAARLITTTTTTTTTTTAVIIPTPAATNDSTTPATTAGTATTAAGLRRGAALATHDAALCSGRVRERALGAAPSRGGTVVVVATVVIPPQTVIVVLLLLQHLLLLHLRALLSCRPDRIAVAS